MYDIVWFNTNSAEPAMNSLALLDDEERIARGKTHHFRMWESVPSPIENGTGFQYCVCTDHRGSVLLNPGAIKDGRATIEDWCSRAPQEVGWIGGFISKEFWGRPDVIAEIENDTKREARNVEDQKKFAHAAEHQDAEQKRAEMRRYFITCAHIGGVWSQNLNTASDQDLFDICQMIDLGANINFPTLEDWLITKFPPKQENKAPYNPMSFLEHASSIRSMMVRREEKTQKMKAS